jgi:hypothetical protein
MPIHVELQSKTKFTVTYPDTEITVHFGTTRRTCPVKPDPEVAGDDYKPWESDEQVLANILILATTKWTTNEAGALARLLNGEKLILNCSLPDLYTINESE